MTHGRRVPVVAPFAWVVDRDIKGLRQEISILRTLHHDNIIALYESFETDKVDDALMWTRKGRSDGC